MCELSDWDCKLFSGVIPNRFDTGALFFVSTEACSTWMDAHMWNGEGRYVPVHIVRMTLCIEGEWDGAWTGTRANWQEQAYRHSLQCVLMGLSVADMFVLSSNFPPRIVSIAIVGDAR